VNILNYLSENCKNWGVLFLILSLILGFFIVQVEASPYYGPTEGQKPLKVSFSVPGGDLCKSVQWTFGDGNVSNTANTSHTYYELGMYYPTLKCELPGADCSYKYDYIYVIPWSSSIRSSKTGGEPTDITVNRTSTGLSAEELKNQANGLVAIGEAKYAVEAFSDLKNTGKLDRDTLIAYGDAEQDLYNYTKAAEIYTEALAEKEDDVVLKKLAYVNYKSGKTNEAIDTINRVVNRSPGDPVAYASLAEMLLTAGKKEESLKAYNTSLKIVDNQPVLWDEYADLLSSQGHLSEAADAYKHAIDLGQSTYETWNNYSAALQKLGRKEEAQKAKEHAMNYYKQPISLSYASDDDIPSCSIGSLC